MRRAPLKLLQVLMSIQALILVPDPFFNEPGYERSRNTAEGDAQSRQYNETIREAAIRYAMIAQIRSPTPEFKEAIQLHFRLRKNALLTQVMTEAPSHPHRTSFISHERSRRCVGVHGFIVRRSLL